MEGMQICEVGETAAQMYGKVRGLGEGWKGLWEWGFLFLNRFHGGGPWGRSSFTGDSRRYVQIVSRYRHLSPQGLL